MKKKVNIGAVLKYAIRVFLIVLTAFLSLEVKAQQDPMYTQYMENLTILNPAYVGSKDVLTAMAVVRNQWVSMPGAPDTRTLAISSPVQGYNMGLGLSFLSDRIGVIKQNGLYLDYAYRLRISTNQLLSLGLKGGINFYEAGLAGLQTNDPNDPVFAQDVNRKFMPNLGVGVFLSSPRYYIGLSAPKLIENKINANGFSSEGISREQIHLFFMTGYVFDINKIVKFKPSVLTSFVANAPVSVSLTGTLLFYDRFWLGTMYRFGDSFGGLFQIQVTNQLKVGYSYDLSINKLSAYNNGTHEIMIIYDFNFGQGKIRSPRYF